MDTVISYLSLAVALASAVISVVTYLRAVKHNRKLDTLNAYNVLQEQALDALNNYTKKEIQSAIDSDDKQKLRELGGYLARIEHFSVGVNTKIYDSDTVYELAHGYLDIGIWYKLQPLIEVKEKNAEYYGNYRKLVEQMKTTELRRKSDTKP